MHSQDFRNKLIRVWIDDVVVTQPASVEIRYVDGEEAPMVSIGLCQAGGDRPAWFHLKESSAGGGEGVDGDSSVPGDPAWTEIPSDTDAILRAMLVFVEEFEGTRGGEEHGE
ncbi:MAG TPA: hypothetical protein VG796_24055 [Verrucomicrobiales bacterium]|nr:hypothetical protein [Verrucomicrobiales bacterium]